MCSRVLFATRGGKGKREVEVRESSTLLAAVGARKDSKQDKPRTRRAKHDPYVDETKKLQDTAISFAWCSTAFHMIDGESVSHLPGQR